MAGGHLAVGAYCIWFSESSQSSHLGYRELNSVGTLLKRVWTECSRVFREMGVIGKGSLLGKQEFKSVHSSPIRCLLQSEMSHVSILISPSFRSPSPNQISLSSRSLITKGYQWLLRETRVIPGTHF